MRARDWKPNFSYRIILVDVIGKSSENQEIILS